MQTARKVNVKSQLPTSRAKTAYALLGEICKLIEAEPKRYNQHRFLARRGVNRDIFDNDAPRGFPRCNTVGCVAGWVAILKQPDVPNYHVVEQAAENILGLSDRRQAMELFSGAALQDEDGNEPKPQTRAHARAGIKHIRKFRRKYRAQLLAKKV